MSFRTMLNLTATIRRKTESVDTNTGGVTATWANAYTNVACAVQPTTESQEMFSMRENGVARGEVFFPYSTDIQHTDQVVPDSGEFSGLILSVTGFPVDHSGRGTYLKVPFEYRIAGGVR